MKEVDTVTPDISVTWDGQIAVVQFDRAPQNYFDVELLADLRDRFTELGADGRTRCIVLASAGRHFCAGADFRRPVDAHHRVTGEHLYDIAADLFAVDVPVVAAVQGAAVGGGFGLALVADERVSTIRTRWIANFTRLGFHPGFGLTASLPWTIGERPAAVVLGTGREVVGVHAATLGLSDAIVDEYELLDAAVSRAREWAALAPLAVRSVRATSRAPLIAGVRAALARERAEQERLMATRDWHEGVRAAAERRIPHFEGA